MHVKHLTAGSLLATCALIVAVAAAAEAARDAQPGALKARSAPMILADASAAMPSNVPAAAAHAMQLAQKWRGDAQMIDVRVRQSENYVLEFQFHSPSDGSFFDVRLLKGQFTTKAMPPMPGVNTGGPLPLAFLDLPAAIAKAEQQGMPHVIKEASLQTSDGGRSRVAWEIQPVTEDGPYLYTIDAGTGVAPSVNAAAPGAQRAAAPGSTPSASGVGEPVLASGLLQKCLGIMPGADRMMRGPATQQYCRQLPGANLYDQAGQRFQAGDHAGAAQIVTKAADAGNAVAQLRIALMYDQGDGVAQSSKAAFAWYSRAAAQGEPESLNQLGLFYEGGEGVAENWDRAAKLYQASAAQGWLKGQFSLGRAYQFGIGVPQSRQQAIAWYDKAAAQGEPNARYWANWLRSPTNNIGFRDDSERSIVMDVAGRLRFSGVLLGGDPAGVAFHNSAQRALWLAGQRQRADKDEADTFARIRQAQHEECVRAHRDNC